MNPVSFLISLAGAMLGLNLLAVFTKWADDYRNDRAAEVSESRPLLEGKNLASEQALQRDAVPDEETAGFWWKRLLTLKGMAGLVLCPLLLPILLVNSYIIALNLEVIFGFVPPPLFTLIIWQWEREVDIFDLYGLLCSLGQMISASLLDQVVQQERKKEAGWFQTLLAWMAASALLSLVVFEVASASYRGWLIGGRTNAVLSATLAFGLAALEAGVGIFIVDYFFYSLLLAVFWSAAAPVGSLLRSLGYLRRSLLTRFSNTNPFVAIVVYPLAAIEQSVMLPLRTMDRLILRMLLRGYRRYTYAGHRATGAAFTKVIAGALLVALIVGLLGCQGIVSPPKPQIKWILAQDTTTSIPKKLFDTMREELIPRVVLSRMRSRDEAHVLPVNSQPEEDVKVFLISGKRTGLHTEIAAIFAHIQSNLNQPHAYRGTTNIGGVLAYAKRISVKVSEEQKRAEAMGKARTSPPLFVVTIFTDGKLEGLQEKEAGDWPPNIMVWFFGVHRLYEKSLKKWATEEMGLGEHQLELVRMSDWKTMSNIFGRRIDRPREDPQVLESLGLAESPISVAGNKAPRRPTP